MLRLQPLLFGLSTPLSFLLVHLVLVLIAFLGLIESYLNGNQVLIHPMNHMLVGALNHHLVLMVSLDSIEGAGSIFETIGLTLKSILD